MRERPTDAEVVAAIRLALAGANTDYKAVRIIHALVDEAEPSEGQDTASVELLLKTARTLALDLVFAGS